MNRLRHAKLILGMVASFLIVISSGCVTVQNMLTTQAMPANSYKHFLNSPDVNIYWNSEQTSKNITIYGAFQNNYYTDLAWVNLYIDLLDSKGKVIQRRYQFFLEAKPGTMLPFRVTFTRLKDAKKVRFSFDYNYAEWKSSVSNYGILEDSL